MIDRQHDEIHFLCDGNKCHESLETGRDNWQEAMAYLKRKGWRVIKDGTEWLHLCKDCKHDY